MISLRKLAENREHKVCSSYDANTLTWSVEQVGMIGYEEIFNIYQLSSELTKAYVTLTDPCDPHAIKVR